MERNQRSCENIEKENITKIINITQNIVDIKLYNVTKIEIYTKSKYYNVTVFYYFKDINDQNKNKNNEMFIEVVIEKRCFTILHCFSNEMNINTDFGSYETEKDDYSYKDIIKIFYKDNRWNCINEDINIFNNFDIYPIINNDFCYTYILKNNKIRFISKCKIQDFFQIYNQEIVRINIINNKYEINFFKKNKDKTILECRYHSKCINPKCKNKHPNSYNLNKAYIDYIVRERNKNSNFKSMKCNNNDNNCIRHKYNSCIFLHENDPIVDNLIMV